ncbi:Hypothetical protein, putative [Bodo saltans]|uniref:Uncharacterized protein n=1 Tax=Bodo saltans TaxID=75058 RepID=A0A0S4JNY9_BODSA|nr:Hypothetical protein, putative [Bodo saltans]|eukprot:CUG91053.1 Hypothetical protein, putative [Bodo saltans]
MGQRLTRLLFGDQETKTISDKTTANTFPQVVNVQPASTKRQRARREADDMDILRATDTNVSNSSAATFLATATTQGGPVQAVCYGARVESTYGAPYHLYTTPDIAAAHGVALGWDLRHDNTLTASALLRLARVANAAKKSLVLVVGEDNGLSTGASAEALELSYSPNL